MDTHSYNAGITGIIATATSIGISLLPEIEAWLRVVSLIIGIAVGIASLVVIYENWNKRK
jgi:uncharacterized membrane protein YgaE (UPF0421/DUF939 family)